MRNVTREVLASLWRARSPQFPPAALQTLMDALGRRPGIVLYDFS
jgi:hypothetical protein